MGKYVLYVWTLVCFVFKWAASCFSSHQIQLKLVTSNIFKGKKESYPQSVAQPFVDTRISTYQKHSQHRSFLFECVQSFNILVGDQDINMRVLQMIRNEHIKVIQSLITQRRFSNKSNTYWLCFTLCFCSTVSQWLNMTGMASNRGRGSSSSPRRLPTWSRRPRSNREFCTRRSKVRRTWWCLSHRPPGVFSYIHIKCLWSFCRYFGQ